MCRLRCTTRPDHPPGAAPHSRKCSHPHAFLSVRDTAFPKGPVLHSHPNLQKAGNLRPMLLSPDVRFEPEEILAEDFVFNMKALRHIHTIAAVDECLYYFRRYSEGSLSKQLHSWETCLFTAFFMHSKYPQTHISASSRRMFSYSISIEKSVQ